MKLVPALAALVVFLLVPHRSWADAPLVLGEATQAELAALPGVGDPLAAAIVRWRAERGGVASVEQLRVLPEMTEAALTTLRQRTWVELELPADTERKLETVDDVLASFQHEPSVGVVQGWAAAYAQVQPATVRKWLAASKGFAALPQVRFEYRLRDDFQNDFEAFTNAGPVSSAQDADAAVDVQTDANVGQDRTLLVRATWDLDALVMSSEQIRVINEAQDVVKLREKILGEVTRLFFERRRLQVDMLLAPKFDLMGQVRDELRLAELTASLDAYTGGRFSEALR